MIFDEDRNGSISKQELLRILQVNYINSSGDQVRISRVGGRGREGVEI